MKKREIPKTSCRFPEIHSLDMIFENSYDSIFVTDKEGTVLMVNPAGTKLLMKNREALVGRNVNQLVKSGLYHYSTAMEATRKKQVVTGLVKTWQGLHLMSTSAPLLDEKGEVVMVITNSREKDTVDIFVAALEKERDLVCRYKSTVNYLAHRDNDEHRIVAASEVMQNITRQVRMIAWVDSTIVISGESGTGKEVVAQYIHQCSQRSQEPFIPVNCAAIPAELAESEFFGYERGAFTGACPRGKPGFFEMADRGTLFLDEISEMPGSLQSKLLRVLETGEVQRIGGRGLKQVDVRVIAASNKNLKELVQKNVFRDDLYYRLNVFPLYLPPLRERKEDILALAEKFLQDYNKKYGLQKTLGATLLKSLAEYPWPGNVRELRNVIERWVIISGAEEMDAFLSFPAQVPIAGETMKLQEFKQEDVSVPTEELKVVLRRAEREHIQKMVAECNGNMSQAARKLGIHRSILYRKMK